MEEQRDQLVEMSHRLEQATHAKLIFFTNVSHDFRTPLTLISSPVEELMADKTLTEKQHALLGVAWKNVKILLQLINELLDFRRYENGKMEMNFRRISLAESISDWSKSFSVQARKQHVRFEILNNLPGKELTITADPEKLERILFNLLSNAFKFVPVNGLVQIRLDDDTAAVIRVYDSGKSIPKDKQPKILDRFFTESVHHYGSGIGLALTRTFVELHNGTISVDSEEGKGCTFIVRIPESQTHIDENDMRRDDSTISAVDDSLALMSTGENRSPLEDGLSQPYDESSEKPSLLVIDDNKDICHYLKTSLEEAYQVRYVLNGAEGLKLAARYVPDLIICDVMMPDMDGYACCERLKKEVQTSHIPVILLTACSLDEQRVKGFDCGADSYISKPFNRNVLKARIHNLIETCRQLKAVFTTNSDLSLDTNSKTPVDDSFVKRLNDLINEKAGDSSFNVDNMADSMHLSRVQLYRKVKALTNYTPVEILRIMRLRKAERLLSSTEMTVSEVAYESGFTSPSYFTKCYKEYYGVNPTGKCGGK